MTIGSGIAVAAMWIAAAVVCRSVKDRAAPAFYVIMVVLMLMGTLGVTGV